MLPWPEYICPNQQSVGQNLQDIFFKAQFYGQAAIAQLAQACLQHTPVWGGMTEQQHIAKVQNAWNAAGIAPPTPPDWETVRKELNH
jgi:hypothetical protein